jgi:GNAT superfamily N-acetyltransferase
MDAPPTPVIIRPLAPADSIAELTNLLHRAYKPLADMGLRFVATWQDEAITRRRIAKGECWVAEEAGRLVGTVTFLPIASTSGSPWYDRPDVASLQQLAVDPSRQGSGLGGRLIDTALERARATGAAELALDTSEQALHLIELYSRRGFRFIEHVRWPAVNYRSVVMSKSAAAPPGGAAPPEGAARGGRPAPADGAARGGPPALEAGR